MSRARTPMLRDGNAADFGIIFGGDDDLERSGQRAVAPDNLGMVLVEHGLIGIRFDAGGLVASRPNTPGLLIAKKDVGAPAIARGIFAPASDRNIAPAAVARTRRGEHHGVAAVGKQLRSRSGIVRSLEPADYRRNKFPHLRGRGNLFRARPCHQHVARRALLQQEFGGLHDRLGVEASAHRAVLQSIRNRNERHALMVGHESADDCQRPSPSGSRALV